MIFSRWQLATILNFYKHKILFAEKVWRIEAYKYTKFCRNWFIHSGNIAIFLIFTVRRYAKRGICRRRVSVCVCLPVTLRYCIKTTKRRITQITPHDSSGILVFWHQSSRRNSNGITPYGGDKCRWGGLKLVTFDEKRAITRKQYKIDI